MRSAAQAAERAQYEARSLPPAQCVQTSQGAFVWLPACRLPAPSALFYGAAYGPLPCAQALLAELQALDDAALAQWALSHRSQLSLGFLTWLAEQEAEEEEQQQQQPQPGSSGAEGRGAGRGAALWALGSKLMALREGLSPVSSEQLQRELSIAASAQRRSFSASGGSGGSGEGGPAGTGLTPAAVGLSGVVQQSAALGLSPQGMALLQQQAAALEAVVGTARARSLTELLGRARVASEQQAQGAMVGDAAVSSLRMPGLATAVACNSNLGRITSGG